jgi:hypothetical protein
MDPWLMVFKNQRVESNLWPMVLKNQRTSKLAFNCIPQKRKLIK